MVLTRRQEAMLKKQYKVGEFAKDEETRASPPVICNGRPEEEDPRTPSTSRSSRSTARRMSNGQHTGLRSALKKYHTERPWEEREIRMMNRLSIIDTDKHARIGSEKNEVFEFEKDPVSSTDTESDSEDDVKRRPVYSCLLTGGFFGVPRKPARMRLIFGRRPANTCER